MLSDAKWGVKIAGMIFQTDSSIHMLEEMLGKDLIGKVGKVRWTRKVAK